MWNASTGTLLCLIKSRESTVFKILSGWQTLQMTDSAGGCHPKVLTLTLAILFSLKSGNKSKSECTMDVVAFVDQKAYPYEKFHDLMVFIFCMWTYQMIPVSESLHVKTKEYNFTFLHSTMLHVHYVEKGKNRQMFCKVTMLPIWPLPYFCLQDLAIISLMHWG